MLYWHEALANVGKGMHFTCESFGAGGGAAARRILTWPGDSQALAYTPGVTAAPWVWAGLYIWWISLP